MQQNEGTSEAVIVSQSAHPAGGVVCMAITDAGEWLRLYPVSVKRTDDAKDFARWKRVRFNWQRSADDARPESVQVLKNSIEIIGELAQGQRYDFLTRGEIKTLSSQKAAGKTLAVVRPLSPRFLVERKTETEQAADKRAYEVSQGMKNTPGYHVLVPQPPAPFKFKYTFALEDGSYECAMDDWTLNTTFANLSKRFAEPQVLAQVIQVFARDYPQKGMLLALTTHPATGAWMIASAFCMDEMYKHAGHSLNLTA